MDNGVKWFKLDVHLDDKFKLIEAEFGLTGFAVVVKLFQKIYGGQGYYCEWTNDVALLFSRENGLGCNVVSEIVSASIKRGIFDKRLYDEYSILTSKGIQKRYFDAVSRRTEVEIEKRYLLIKVDQILKNVNIFSENASFSAENVNKNPQSRVEESRVEEIRGDNISASQSETDTPAAKSPKHKYGEFKHVLLKDDEYKKLCESYSNADELIQYLDEYIEMKGYKAKSHYLCIKKWVVDAVKEKHMKERKLREQKKSSNPFLDLLQEGELGE